MAIITNPISYYRVGSVHRHENAEKIEIKLYQNFGRGVTRNIAILSFSTSYNSPEIIWPATGTIAPVRANYEMDSYERIIDLLRNEKPLNLISIRNWNRISIQTGNEPIGEEES